MALVMTKPIRIPQTRHAVLEGSRELVKEDLSAIIDCLEDAVFLVDPLDMTAPVTTQASRMMNCPKTSRLNIHEVAALINLPIDDMAQRLRALKRRQIRQVMHEPSLRKVYDVTAKLIVENKMAVGTVMILHDITDSWKENHLQSEFVSMVAHELLNPLAPLLEGLNLLREERIGAINETQKHCLNVVADEAARLSRLVNDLRDINRLDTGKIRLQRESIDLPRLIESAIQNVAARAAAKNIRIDAQMGSSSEDFFGDFDRLRQVLINLIENAVKYSPENTTVSVVASCPPKQVRIEVRDEGYGIARNDVKRLFDRFVQLGYPEHVRNRGKGSGLGLSIVWEIVRLHRGKIDVQSELNQGSQFILSFPKRKRGRKS